MSAFDDGGRVPRLTIMKALHYVLAPVALPQALWLKRTALHMPEPDGPRAGTCGRGRRLRVLMVGDSSVAGVGVRHQRDALSGHLTRALADSYRVEWKVIAKSGATVPETLVRLDAQLPDRFDAVVIGLGVNDAKNGGTLPAWRRDYAQLLDLLQSKFGAACVYASGLPPVREFPILKWPTRSVVGTRVELFDEALEQLVAERSEGVRYIAFSMDLGPQHMAEDGFHPGAEVYGEWAKQVSEAIAADFPTHS